MSDVATVGTGITTPANPQEAVRERNISALSSLRAGLKRHFGPEAGIFVDPFLWLLGSVSVDIVRLDNWLTRRNPDYRDDESMRLFIRRKYGRNAERFIEHWLKGELRTTISETHPEQERRLIPHE